MSKKILAEMKCEVDSVGESISGINRARRDYESALTKIRQYEAFLAPHFEGLGYDQMEFRVSDDLVTYKAGRLEECPYWPFFTKDENGWHFKLAPWQPVDGAPTKPVRLLDAPAGLVLHCAEAIPFWAATVLEELSWVLEESYPAGLKRRAASAMKRTPALLTLVPTPTANMN